jgi:hypothetical protein
MSETPDARLSPRELWQQQNEAANENLTKLVSEVTQREWLIITTALDRTRQQIGADTGLTLLAGAWISEKRKHGGASWDRLLDMTDDQLATLLGFPEGDGSDLATTVQPEPAPTADQIADEAIERANAHTTAAAGVQLGHDHSSAQNPADASASAQAS